MRTENLCFLASFYLLCTIFLAAHRFFCRNQFSDHVHGTRSQFSVFPHAKASIAINDVTHRTIMFYLFFLASILHLCTASYWRAVVENMYQQQQVGIPKIHFIQMISYTNSNKIQMELFNYLSITKKTK